MAKKRSIPYQAFEPEDSIFRKLQAKRARSYQFLIDADMEMLKNLCDRWFNQAENKAFRFRPVAPLVLVTVINNSCATGNCERATWEKGECPYLAGHCSRILLLDDFNDVQGAVKCNQCWVTIFVQRDHDDTIYGFTPYRFVDSGMLMIRNREMLGLPDVVASLKFPRIPQGQAAEANFSLSTRMKLKRAFPKEPEPLIRYRSRLAAAKVIPHADEVLLIDADPEVRSHLTPWKNTSEVLSGVLKLVKEYADEPGRQALLRSPLMKQASPFAMMNKWVSLKQFRVGQSDRSAPDEAAYQAIVEYEYQPMKIHGGGRIDGRFIVKFPQIDKEYVDSLQFVFNLGVKAENEVLAAYWIDFDYELNFRNLMWEAE